MCALALMRPLTDYNVVLFDFDGVILDSNPVKTEAFRTALADYPPALVERFVAYHRANGGVSRYVKLRRFFSEFVPVADPQAACAAALERFGALARDALMRAPIVPGVTAVLERLRVPTYVVSGADQQEVRDVLAARGLGHHFARVLGSPVAKEEHVRQLLRSGELPAPGLFFGDARKDMEVAEGAGLDFVYVGGATEWDEGARVCAERGHGVVPDFRALHPG